MGRTLRTLSAIQYKVLDHMRHRDAFTIARESGTAGDFSTFRGERQCLLVTFKRSGDPVPSPVNFGLSDGKVYMRSEPDVAKIRRIARDPHVRVCACSFRGKPRGPVIEATARVLPAAENERAHAVIAANWDPLSRVFERGMDRLGVPLAYVEITPVTA